MNTRQHLCTAARFFSLAACLLFSTACEKDAPSTSSGEITQAVSMLPSLQFCKVENPLVPSSAFNIFHSEKQGKSGYWVEYSCKEPCPEWSECLVPAYANDNGDLLYDGRETGKPKTALSFVVDGMGGHIALNAGGDKTVFIHTGAGGTRYYVKPALGLEQDSSARTVMMRWEKGYVASEVQAPFTQPISWGWFSRTSAEASDISQLNRKVASVIDWVHENISSDNMYATFGCSMGTNATFGPVLWHGLDPVIDYQMFVGGPNMWDLNAQCRRRVYTSGYCDLDGQTPCQSDSECSLLGTNASCSIAAHYTTIDRLFQEMPNHVHATDACDIQNSDDSTEPYAPFDRSSMAYADDGDWNIDHPIDLLVNVGAAQGETRAELGGDEYWALGHFPHVFNRMQSASDKRWLAFPGTHHCGAMFDEAVEVIKRRMEL